MSKSTTNITAIVAGPSANVILATGVPVRRRPEVVGMLRVVLAALAICLPLPGQAVQQATVCAKMRLHLGWSKASQVEATLVTGQELERASGNLNRYSPIATFVLISDDKNGVTLIQMASPQIGHLPTYGNDQQGRRWSVSTQLICL